MQKRRKIIFFLYLILVVKLVIFKYPIEDLKAIAASWQKDVILEGLYTANFTLFKTIRMYIDYAYKLNSFENLVGNIVLFIPFGFLLPLCMKQGCNFFLNAFLFVLGIEVFQLFSAFGAFDVDDILLNCLGAVMGYCLYIIAKAIKKRKRKKERQENG